MITISDDGEGMAYVLAARLYMRYLRKGREGDSGNE